MILDTNGNGKRDEYVEPNQPVDPTKDKRIVAGFYAVMPQSGRWLGLGHIPELIPARWCGSRPAAIPPRRRLAEIYNVPLPGFGTRGGDIDKQGVVWVSLASGHLGSFDRRKCKGPLNGPKATGDHCPEGWSFYQYPGPGFKGIGENSAESSYYTWVDQHNTFGLGDDVPMSTGNLNDGLVAYERRQDDRSCACRILWDFTPKVSTAASMIPKPAGRGVDCGVCERRPHAVAQRKRQRRQADGRAFPVAARSAGEITSRH